MISNLYVDKVGIVMIDTAMTAREWHEMADYVLPEGQVARGLRLHFREQRLADLTRMEDEIDHVGEAWLATFCVGACWQWRCSCGAHGAYHYGPQKLETLWRRHIGGLYGLWKGDTR